MGGAGVLVGRDRELGVLSAALADARQGLGRVVCLSGEPGVGKTATARAFAGAAEAGGALVLWATCHEGTSQAPYGPWEEAVTPLGTPLESDRPDLPAPDARLRLFDAVQRSVAGAARDVVVVLVLDDLQWASSDSLGLFGHVAARVGANRMLLLGTYRDPDPALDGATPLGTLLARLARLPGYVQAHLRGLSVDDVAHYLLQALGDAVPATIVRAVHDQTGGNPFYVREVAKVLVEEGKLVRRDGRWLSDFSIARLGIPDTVRDAVRGRLAGLSASTTAFLQAASAFSGDLDLETVRDVAGLTEADALDAVDEAVACGFLQRSGRARAPYAFVHAIVRHALVESLNPDRAARLHRRAAATLARLRPDDHAAIAEQYGLSAALPGAERGVDHCMAAAGAAMSQQAHRQAVRLLHLALDLVRPDDAMSRTQVLCRLAAAQGQALDFERAPATTLMAVEGLGADAAADLIVEVVEALREGAPVSAYEALVRRGLDLAGDRHDARWARLVVLLDPVETVEAGELRVGRWFGHSADVVSALLSTGREDDEARAVEPFRPRTEAETATLLARSREWSSVRAQLRALDLAGRDLSLRHGRPLDAVDCYRQLLDLGELAGSLPAKVEGAGQLALCLALVGDLPPAEEHLVRAADLVRDLWPGHRLHLLGTTSSSVIVTYMLGAGDWGGLAGRLSQWLGGPAPAHAPFATVFAALAGLCHAMAGDAGEARRWIGPVTDVLALLDHRDHGVPGSLWFTAAAVWELQDKDAAQRLAPFIDRHRAAGGPPGPASLAHARARLAMLLGDRQRAVELLGVARSETAAAGARSLAALVDWDDAVIRDDREAAAAALASFERLGMRGWAARVPAWANAPAPARPFGLTGREVEVLGRLAAGRTSQEIAGDLFISVATVNRHIANIYVKIDARNRAEATSFAIAQGIAGL